MFDCFPVWGGGNFYPRVKCCRLQGQSPAEPLLLIPPPVPLSGIQIKVPASDAHFFQVMSYVATIYFSIQTKHWGVFSTAFWTENDLTLVLLLCQLWGNFGIIPEFAVRSRHAASDRQARLTCLARDPSSAILGSRRQCCIWPVHVRAPVHIYREAQNDRGRV